jgi:hypothetical protein
VEVDLGELSRAVGHEVTSYQVEAIDPQLRLHSVTGGVYRVSGDGFSLVIKVVIQGEDSDPHDLWVTGVEPEHRNYWKREWLAYRTGLLDALPGQLRAPRTYLTTEPSETECWIWLEDVSGRPGPQWEIDDYDSVAFDLGTTQSAFANGRSVMPSQPWLSRQWLRSWVETLERRIPNLDDDDRWADEPLASLAPLRSRIKALWAERETLLTVVETARQTIVHLDFWPTNLIAADDGTTVAIDWSQVGIGAIAQDIDQIILDPVWMSVIPDGSFTDLETHVVRGYVSGLRSSGLDLGEASIRRWYAAAASIHYAPLLALAADKAADPKRLEARFGRPYEQIIRDRGRVISHALDLGESVLAGG